MRTMLDGCRINGTHASMVCMMRGRGYCARRKRHSWPSFGILDTMATDLLFILLRFSTNFALCERDVSSAHLFSLCHFWSCGYILLCSWVGTWHRQRRRVPLFLALGGSLLLLCVCRATRVACAWFKHATIINHNRLAKQVGDCA